MKCPHCNAELDKVEVNVSSSGVGEIDDNGYMLVKGDSEELQSLYCEHCDAQLPLALVSSWDWKEEE